MKALKLDGFPAKADGGGFERFILGYLGKKRNIMALYIEDLNGTSYA